MHKFLPVKLKMNFCSCTKTENEFLYLRRQASIFAQSSLILNYCHHKLAKPNKSCFIPKERGTFLLSNGTKNRANVNRCSL